jgi:membrane protease YdiL (CAAX protease family)
MHVAAACLGTLLVVVMVVVQPLVGRRRYRVLVRRVGTDPTARLRHYVRGIVGEWIYVGIVAVVGVLAGRHAASIGLTLHHLEPGALTTALGLVVLATAGLVVTIVIIWRAGPSVLGLIRRQVSGFVELLPRTRRERVVCAGLAVTAGICEEILYRGFGIAYLKWLFPGAGDTAIILTIGVAFGIVHLYQGPRNVVLTGIVGGLFAWLTLATGTLVPAIVIHALVDLHRGPAHRPGAATHVLRALSPNRAGLNRRRVGFCQTSPSSPATSR